MASTVNGLSKERLDEVVDAIKKALSDDDMRALSQRAVQGKVWHYQPAVAAYLTELRHSEEAVREEIMKQISSLVYRFHEHTIDATLARAGILTDDRVHAGSSLDKKEAFDLFCLDAKERLYLILKQYGWLHDFFRNYPQHFYENSFEFVHRIPTKKLKVKVKVVGLGIGGSMAVSGLAKAGVQSVVGYEKRDESGARRVGSRYQNASWRAYDIAERLLDEPAYEHLITYRQRINVNYDDGTSKVVTSDRVQIILGNAIEAALGSAKRFGAKLVYGCTGDEYFKEDGSVEEEADLVALFTGAHTSEIFPGLSDEMNIYSWPELSSDCRMWLRIKASDRTEDYCTRGGEIGAEKWHYTIESARRTVDDVLRIKDNLSSQYKNSMKKIAEGRSSESAEEVTAKFEQQTLQCDKVLLEMDKDNGTVPRFDYIFTNAPDNEHNRAKREMVGGDGTVVLDGGYTVDIKIASNSKVGGKDVDAGGEKLLSKFSTNLLLTGGDACVPPNPLAAYGATLACESADMVVQLAIGYGHLNTILSDMEEFSKDGFVDEQWMNEVKALKDLLSSYYDARGRAENYFQWVQTLICNLYSLPPMA